MCDIQNWLTFSPEWSAKHYELIQITKRDKKLVKLDKIIKKSEEFPIKFPIDTIRNKTLLKTVPKHILERNAQSAYPIIHETALYLCAEFILFKLNHGSEVEKKLYNGMSVLDFIERILTKRAVVFVGSEDFYMLRDGTLGVKNKWERIGTDDEEKPLILEDYMSYDELKLSALLSVSSYSYFINNGCRKNHGIPGNRDEIESEGIIIGVIGTRLRRQNVMDYQEIILSENPNINNWNIRNLFNFFQKSNNDNPPNIRNFFHNFFQETFYTYQQVKDGNINDTQRFNLLKNGFYFDNAVYAKRLAVSFDTLLLEANHRAQEKGKSAYIHVVGFGLGVWRISHHQEEQFVSAFGNRIRVLGSNLKSISDVDFSYFPRTSHCLGYESGSIIPIEGHPFGGIKIQFSRREPFTKLPSNDKLLVVSYAWDSNAHPGNEFWDGHLGDSGDSATASSSQVSELHNAVINPTVNANNLMVATPRGVVSAQDYLQRVVENITKEDKL